MYGIFFMKKGINIACNNFKFDFRGGWADLSPRKRNVGFLNSSRDRHNSFEQVVAAPLPNARVSVTNPRRNSSFSGNLFIFIFGLNECIHVSIAGIRILLGFLSGHRTTLRMNNILLSTLPCQLEVI